MLFRLQELISFFKTIISFQINCQWVTSFCLVFALTTASLTEEQPATPSQAFIQWTNPKDQSTLIWIPGGEFILGNDISNNLNKSQCWVKVEGFWLGKYEITNEQYALFIKETAHRKPDFWNDKALNLPNNPVVGMTWEDAISYCQWAGVRLPSEVEWEYAATFGGHQFCYGTATGDINHNLANYSGAQEQDCWLYTSPVGSFPPNPFGLYDLAGNVWEWCENIYQSDPVRPNEIITQTEREKKGFRVMKGGSWHYGPDHCRVIDRHYHKKHLRYDYVGFRIAVTDTTIDNKKK